MSRAMENKKARVITRIVTDDEVDRVCNTLYMAIDILKRKHPVAAYSVLERALADLDAIIETKVK
jgi:hypothetical protein